MLCSKKLFVACMCLAFGGFATAVQAQVPRERCDEVIRDSSLKWAKEEPKTELVPQVLKPASTFASDAKVECNLSWEMFSSKPMRQYQVEKGAKGGVPYDVYYSDGSGSIPNNPENKDEYLQSWHFKCEKDPIEDTKSCYLNYGGFFLWQYGNGRQNVHVGGRAYPGSEIVIRIDGGAPIRASEKTGFTAEQSRQIVTALKGAKKVVTRWTEWPSGNNKDEAWDVYNFVLALERLEWSLKSIE